MAKAPDVSKLKRALMRSNTRLLLSAVLLFQFAACLLLALKTQPLDTQALLFAAAISAAGTLGLFFFARGRAEPLEG